MTTHYEYAVMAQQAYKRKGGTPPSNWSAVHYTDLEIDDDVKKSLSRRQISIVFYRCDDPYESKQLVIAIRGTVLSNVKNLMDDLQILFKKDLSVTARRVKNLIAEGLKNYPGYSFSFTGHSLGAFLAECMACQYRVKAVTFESPGSLGFQATNVQGYNTTTNIVAYLSGPNAINTTNRHIGSLYRVYVEEPFFTFTSLTNYLTGFGNGILNVVGMAAEGYVTHTWNQHSMNNIVAQFDSKTGYAIKQSDVTSWPTKESFHTAFIVATSPFAKAFNFSDSAFRTVGYSASNPYVPTESIFDELGRLYRRKTTLEQKWQEYDDMKNIIKGPFKHPWHVKYLWSKSRKPEKKKCVMELLAIEAILKKKGINNFEIHNTNLRKDLDFERSRINEDENMQAWADSLLEAVKNNDAVRTQTLTVAQSNSCALPQDWSFSTYGWNPFHWAAFFGNRNIIGSLKSKFGAEYLNTPTSAPWFFGFFGFKGRQTPAEIARINRHPDAQALLVQVPQNRPTSGTYTAQNKDNHTHDQHHARQLRNPNTHPVAKVMHSGAKADYIRATEYANGTPADNPKKQRPLDGSFSWINSDARSSGIRYTESSSDAEWMEEKYRNYLQRIERERALTERQTRCTIS
ncbi:MAG: hypothetical protein ABIH77_02005 [Pseudomonadota bacterium]